MTRRTAVLSLSALAAVALGVAGLSRAAPAKTGELLLAAGPATAPVQLAPVRGVRTAPREEITGTLQPAKALQLGFEVPGRLEKILVTKGQKIAQGQIVAELNTEVSDAQVAQATAAVAAAEAQAGAATDVAGRNQKLQQSGAVTELQLNSSAATAQAAAAQLAAAKAQLAQARAARARHVLRAPFAATVIDAPDQVGATVGPGAQLFFLEQLDSLTLKITAPLSARGSVRAGARVHVEAVSGGVETDAAVVRVVIPSADAATRRVPIEIAIPNHEGRFTAHTLARVALPLGDEEPAQTLPASALSSAGGDHVFVVGDASEVRRVPVTVLDRGAREVVVKASEPLERVVDFPAQDLAEGAKVAVKN